MSSFPNDQHNPASAIPVLVVTPSTPLGYQQITSLGSAVGLTVPTGAKIAVISVTGAGVRYRDDGTDPTASVGMPLPSGTVGWTYSGDLEAIKFIEQTGTAALNVSYY